MVHILHVDDDEEDRFLVSTMLTEQGIDVSWAHGFDDAVAKVADGEFDALLVDVRLGTASGLELIQQARRNGYKGPCVVLTGMTEPSIDDRALELGAAAFLQKDELTGPLLARAIKYAAVGRVGTEKARRADLPLQVALARGLSIRQAAESVGVSERTVHRRLTSEPFRQEIERVKVKLLDTMIDRIADDLLT